MDLSNPMLMSMMNSREGGDIWKTMMMMQAMGGNNNGNGAPEINNQRLQMMMLVPMGKRFIRNLSKKLQVMDEAKRMDVIAALITGQLGEKQSDDFGEILKNSSMSMLMQLVGMSSMGGLMMSDNASLGREPANDGEVGGEVIVRRVVKAPSDEAADIELMPARSNKTKAKNSDEGIGSTIGFHFT